MKANPQKKNLTFGEFIMAVYDVCGDKRRARGILRLAAEAHLILVRGYGRLMIS